MFTGNSRLLSWKLKIMRSCIKFMLLDDIYHLLKSCQHDDLHIFMFLSRHLSPSISCQIKHLNPHNSEVILLTLENKNSDTKSFMKLLLQYCEECVEGETMIVELLTKMFVYFEKRQIGFPIILLKGSWNGKINSLL